MMIDDPSQTGKKLRHSLYFVYYHTLSLVLLEKKHRLTYPDRILLVFQINIYSRLTQLLDQTVCQGCLTYLPRAQ